MLNDKKILISFSIVSHGQLEMIRSLLYDFEKINFSNIEIIITLNIKEKEIIFPDSLPIKVIRNTVPFGFGKNHNQAFMASSGDFFAVVNPDIRFDQLNLDKLLNTFKDQSIGAVAPMVISPSGLIDDSARLFPTFFSLLKRFFLKERTLDYKIQSKLLAVDWVGGMFIVFRSSVFSSLNGFDDKRFYMYFEDVDICSRLNAAGHKLVLNPESQVIHYAQRNSRKNIQHLVWHLTSAFRYFMKI